MRFYHELGKSTGDSDLITVIPQKSDSTSQPPTDEPPRQPASQPDNEAADPIHPLPHLLDIHYTCINPLSAQARDFYKALSPLFRIASVRFGWVDESIKQSVGWRKKHGIWDCALRHFTLSRRGTSVRGSWWTLGRGERNPRSTTLLCT